MLRLLSLFSKRPDNSVHSQAAIKPGYHVVPDIYGRSSRKMIDIRENALFYELAKNVIEQEKSFLYYDRLYTIFQCLANIVRSTERPEELNTLEIGVYRGGGTYFIASVLERIAQDRARVFSIDTFEGHSERDLPNGTDGDHTLANFNDTAFEDVRAYLSRFPFVEVVRGRVQESTHRFAGIPIHFVHLDVDIYEPTRFSLEHLDRQLAIGGAIVVDDYGFVSCPGARRAADEFIASHLDYSSLELLTGQMVLIKNGRKERP